uniref:Uncharacterized protein n=1 Tax=Arundo donax TaxID=35708 RepID=A0A0A9B0L2_ARUDO
MSHLLILELLHSYCTGTINTTSCLKWSHASTPWWPNGKHHSAL